jgi:hypothetical protein
MTHTHMISRTFVTVLALVAVPLAPSCACGEVGSEDDARIAYLGVDQVVTKALALGFLGFNAASSANIPPQSDDGDEAGTIDVTGQVDQGASDNKGMRLAVALEDYSDGAIDDPETDEDDQIEIQYATDDGSPLTLELSLRNIPDGTVTGTLAGTVVMTGDLEGNLELDVTLAGEIESDGSGGTQRVEGSTDVDGTAKGDNGTFDVDATI